MTRRIRDGIILPGAKQQEGSNMQDPGSERRPSFINNYAKFIMARYPDLEGAEMRMVAQGGQFNDALLVDGRLIMRFPRYEQGIEQMRREVAFLRGIRGQTTLPVPDPIYADLESDTLGELFMGYALLPGEPLLRTAVFAQTDDAVLDRWAEQLAGFLQELHAIPPGDTGEEWPTVDQRAEWELMYNEIRHHLFPKMRPAARQEVTDHFAAYLDDPALHDFQPAPRHGDFGSGNILYEAQTMNISGIIDFGFAAVGDPAIDIAAVSTLGDGLFGRFAATYPAVESMLPRARFYRGTYALQEALHGFKSGDREAYEAGMASYM